MFCPNCGKPLPDDSVFCDQCGASIEPEPKQDTPSFPEELPVDAAVKQGPGTMAGLLQLAKEHQKATGILAIVVIAVVALILFLALKLPTVRLNDYLSVEYSGYNTMGTASYRFDTEAFCRDYAETVQYQGAGTSSFLTGGRLQVKLKSAGIGLFGVIGQACLTIGPDSAVSEFDVCKRIDLLRFVQSVNRNREIFV